MACRLPGANSIEEYWRMLLAGENAIGEIPPNRLDQRLYYNPERGVRGQVYSNIAALCDYTPFERQEFSFPEDAARNNDLSHVVALQTAVEALQHAGRDPFNLPSSRTGVFIGHTRGSELIGDLTMATLVEQVAALLHEIDGLPKDLQDRTASQLTERFRQRLPHRTTGGAPHVGPHMLTSLISSVLNLRGPSITLNAACASSLHALLLARQALDAGEIDMALIGGATYSKWDNLVVYSHAQAVSATGSSPLDEAADGLVPGEGYAVVAVRPLKAAIEAGDNILGVVRDIGVSCDGRGKSLWAPRQKGQAAAIRRAYQHGIDPASIEYIEAHATSTSLGDSTEIAALGEVLGESLRNKGRKIPISSVKANIGHTLETAGVAGLIKTLLAMKHQLIPAQTSFRTPSSKIDWRQLPFFVPASHLEWAPGETPRRAAVNAFGIGGLNAHVVVEEHQTTATATPVSVHLPASVSQRDEAPQEPVAIIGMSCVFPGAGNIEELRALRRSQRVMKSDIPPQRWDADIAFDPSRPQPYRSVSRTGGLLENFEYDWKRHRIPPRHIAGANPLQFIILQAVDEALDQINLADFDRSRMGVVVGTLFSSDFADDLQVGIRLPELREELSAILSQDGLPATEIEKVTEEFAKRLLERMPALLDDTGSFSTSTLASRVAKSYDLMGGALAMDAGKASSLAAVFSAVHSLRDGSCETVICVGGQRQLGLCSYEQLSLAGNFTEGFFPAEGAGVLLLKRLDAARRDGDKIHAVIHDVSATFDPNLGEAAQDAICQSKQRCQLSGDDFAHRYIIPTGIADRDATLQTALEQAAGSVQQMPVSQQVGHALGASGMLGILDAIINLQDHAGPESKAGLVSCDEGGAVYHLVLGQHVESETAPKTTGNPSLKNKRDVVSPDPIPAHIEDLPLHLLSGSPYDIGLQIGRAQAGQMHKVVQAYVDVAKQPWAKLPDISREAAEPDVYFGPAQLEEMRGIAAGAGVAFEKVVEHNLRLYPDFGAGCIQWLQSAAASPQTGLIHAANEDIALVLQLRGVLKRSIQIRRYDDGIVHAVFPLTGQSTGITGINAEGIAVTSAMLLDRPRREATFRGRAHAVVVSEILSRAANLDETIEIARANPVAGAWGMCVSDHTRDDLAYIEYDGSEVKVERSVQRLAVANHTRLFPPLAETPQHSLVRLSRFEQLLESGNGVAEIQNALRDKYDGVRGRVTAFPTMNTIRRVDNDISIVMRPALGEVHLTRGASHEGDADSFVKIDIGKLLRDAVDGLKETAADNSRATAVVSLPDASRKSTWDAIAAAREQANLTADAQQANEDADVCSRFIVRFVPGSYPQPTMAELGGVLIWGEDERARELHRQLTGRNITADLLPASMPEDELMDAIDRHCQSAARPHLFLFPPLHASSCPLDPAAWDEARRQMVELPFRICQKWHQHVLEGELAGQASVVAVVAGDNLEQAPKHPLAGCLAGLIKSLKYEVDASGQTTFRAKHITVSEEMDAATTAALVEGELCAGDEEIEIAFAADGQRWLLRPAPAPAADSHQAALPQTGAWVVTGGARGITPLVAREIARRHNVRLHLLGTTSLQDFDPQWRDLSAEQLKHLRAQNKKDALSHGEVPAQRWRRIEKMIEADKNLRDLRQLGVTATYHCCDITDRAALADVLQRIRQQDGAITGVLHGAGYEASSRFSKKTPEAVSRTLGPKVDGAAALMQMTLNDPLQHFIAFGSISARFGNVGQTDYSLANEALVSLLRWLRHERPQCQSAVFAWHSWGEVGMAVRPEYQQAKKRKKFRFMPVAEGAEHVLREIAAGLPESEVVITDWSYMQRFYPDTRRFIPSAPIRADLPPAPEQPPISPRIESIPNGNATPSPEPAVATVEDIAPHTPTRRVLNLVDRPLVKGAGQETQIDRAVLVGDNPDAHALREQLEGMSATVEHLPVYRDPAKSIAELEWIWQEAPFSHLFMMTGRDRDLAKQPHGEYWQMRSELGIDAPLKIAARWRELTREAGLDSQATFVCVTSLGGEFGFGRTCDAPENASFVAVLRRHVVFNGLKQQLILDAPPRCDSNALASIILDELSNPSGEIFVAYPDIPAKVSDFAAAAARD